MEVTNFYKPGGSSVYENAGIHVMLDHGNIINLKKKEFKKLSICLLQHICP